MKKINSQVHLKNHKCCRHERTRNRYGHVSISSCPYGQCASTHVFTIGQLFFFDPAPSKIAPPPSAELESRNPFVLGQFLTIDLPLSSTFKRLNFRPSPEFPIVIGEKNILIGYRIPPNITTAAAVVLLSPSQPAAHITPTVNQPSTHYLIAMTTPAQKMALQ